MGVGLAAALLAGCDATTRHKVLTFFFDGVPPTPAAPAEGVPAAEERPAPTRPAGYHEHGPFAAKLCNACHDSAATNALIVPVDQLCFQCHDLRLGKKYVHGPLASGGCRACHDPHRSPYRYLLVSESDGFCLHCHEAATVMKNEVHRGATEQCTSCHDAHMSDTRFLLK